MRVLVVATTKLGNDACVGALSLDQGTSYRLFDARHDYFPPNKFQVGEILEVSFTRPRTGCPPHVEDILVHKIEQIEVVQDVRAEIMGRITPWVGDLRNIYDGCLTRDVRSHGIFLPPAGTLPDRSTWFWQPANSLTWDGAKYFHYTDPEGEFSIPYVGFGSPLQEIPAQTLVRLSLAKWFRGDYLPELRCYLQVSGWYT